MKLRVGIIGLGHFAVAVHVPELRDTGRADVVAASRRNAGLLALAKRDLDLPATYTDWRDMLANEALDAVVVATPHNHHVEPTLAALDRGLHVLLEKPLCTSVADAQTILSAVNKSDRVVMMGVNRRGNPGWRTAHQLLTSGQIGRVRQLSAVMCGDLRVFREAIPYSPGAQEWRDSGSETKRAFLADMLKPDGWKRDPLQMGGDMLADIGAHTLDVMLWLGGAPAVEVVAYTPQDRPEESAIYTLQALLANGVILSLTFNDQIALGDDFAFRNSGRLTVYGDQGTLTLNSPLAGGGADDMIVERQGERQAVPPQGAPTTLAAAFVAAICDGAPNIATVQDAADVVALTQSTYRSAAERRIVRLAESL